MPGKDEIPSTVARSDDKAARTWVKTFDSAMETYGDGARARRAAFASLKHTHEKIGDHWEPKDGSGPSDKAAEGGGPRNRRPSAGGVDANAPKQHLLDVARRLDVRGRSSMTKDQLVTAIEKANKRETANARS